MEYHTQSGYVEMYYATEALPYDRPHSEATPGALKRGVATVMEQMRRLVDNISAYIYVGRGIEITPSSPDQDIDLLPKLVASLGKLRPLTKEEFETRLQGGRPESHDAWRAYLSREREMEDETSAMAFDAALLWGEAFRYRYPDAEWAIGAKPKMSMNYGDPVLVGIDQYREEFNPVRELYGHISLILLGNPHDWTLTKIMKMRAFSLGFGPDPRF